MKMASLNYANVFSESNLFSSWIVERALPVAE